jgi:hypothetical protein
MTTEVMRWSKFVWADYENDLSLMECSLAAQGLWMRLLCYMHRAAPQGHLVVSGRAATVAQIAQLVRKTPAQVRPLLEELQQANVFDRTPDGIVFCRRMKRDSEMRDRAREYGSRGGNPALVAAKKAKPRQDVKRGVKGRVNPRVNRGVNPREEERRGEESLSGDAHASPADAVAPAGDEGAAKVVQFPQRVDPDEQAAFDAWNALAASTNVHAAVSLDADRRQKLRARLKECGGLAGWLHAIEQVRKSPLWQGQRGTGWRGGFDDILSKAKFRKLMEGGYADNRPAAPTRRTETTAERLVRERLERQEAELRTIEGTAS